jgi:hypothetical protein
LRQEDIGDGLAAFLAESADATPDAQVFTVRGADWGFTSRHDGQLN